MRKEALAIRLAPLVVILWMALMPPAVGAL
jgi:hypothetical protein